MNCMVLWCNNKGKIPGINYFCLTKKRHDAWMQALGRNPIAEHLTKQIKCTVCLDSLEESNYNALDLQFMLLHRKDRGGLIKPSKDVIQICM
ncbi:hypothetical protein JTB14_003139 [Gonioctena quinquepunctata]|nr:hypothetical protein JTB14_003139 [Gonioctena quinquepunctata]